MNDEEDMEEVEDRRLGSASQVIIESLSTLCFASSPSTPSISALRASMSPFILGKLLCRSRMSDICEIGELELIAEAARAIECFVNVLSLASSSSSCVVVVATSGPDVEVEACGNEELELEAKGADGKAVVNGVPVVELDEEIDRAGGRNGERVGRIGGGGEEGMGRSEEEVVVVNDGNEGFPLRCTRPERGTGEVKASSPRLTGSESDGSMKDEGVGKGSSDSVNSQTHPSYFMCFSAPSPDNCPSHAD
ncbi:hypothetical protein CPC08DRAFT_344455 [Agrocybe pediades]|nr:hypothetical protein CPC08DRAFT_344455 [Agrocybe pediades]